MATFMTTHRAPGLSVDEIASNAPDVAKSTYAAFRDMFVNLTVGFLVTVYEADDVQALEREFERVGFPFEEIHEIQFAMDSTGLRAMLAGEAAS
jgi:hypothetical protein